MVCKVRVSSSGGNKGLLSPPHLSLPTLGSTQPPVLWVPFISRGYSTRDVALATITQVAPRLNVGIDYVGMFRGDIYRYTKYVPIAHKL